MSPRPPARESDPSSGTTSSAGRGAAKRSRNHIRALSHPLRARVLRLLVERGKMSPAEIGREIGEASDRVSYHCRQLVAYDCAEMVEEKRVVGKGAVEHFYIATRRTVLKEEDWNGLGRAMGQAFINEAIALIVEDYEASRASDMAGSDASFHIGRTPMVLDGQGIREALDNCERWRLEQAEIELRSAARRSESKEHGTHVSSSLAFFKMPKPKD
jgi:DNA-binding transcriptional ArsR family regulator